MPIPHDYRYAVAFITADRPTADGEARRRPVGTAFVAQVHGSETGKQGLPFLITAAHIIRRVENPFVRIHRKSGWLKPEPGQVEDVPVTGWEYPPDPAHDVAAAPLRIDTDEYYFSPIPFSLDAPDPEKQKYRRTPWLGERVHFLGLLANVEAMGAANIPMLRTGNLGALDQKGVPLRVAPGTTLEVDAHLIDCLSYRGFSGSPVFRQYLTFEWDTTRFRGGDLPYLKPERPTSFFGMLVGHFPIQERGVLGEGDDETEFRFPVNVGVGVVLPISKIRETLNLEPLVEVRRRWEEERESEM